VALANFQKVGTLYSHQQASPVSMYLHILDHHVIMQQPAWNRTAYVKWRSTLQTKQFEVGPRQLTGVKPSPPRLLRRPFTTTRQMSIPTFCCVPTAFSGPAGGVGERGQVLLEEFGEAAPWPGHGGHRHGTPRFLASPQLNLLPCAPCVITKQRGGTAGVRVRQVQACGRAWAGAGTGGRLGWERSSWACVVAPMCT
jgi:hypothetical protein